MTKAIEDRRTIAGTASVQSRRVLVVDDEAMLLDGITKAFSRAGHDVAGCRTFEEARAALLTEDFHCLITDIRLGAFNGLQLAIIARDRHPDMRIIVFSGFDDPVLREETARLKARFVSKPVSFARLLDLVDEC